MIDEEINQILNSIDRSIQWKVIKLQKMCKMIYDIFNSDEFQNQFYKIAPDLKLEIENGQRQVYQIEKTIKENEILIEQKEKIETRHEQLTMEHNKLEELRIKNEALKNLSKVLEEVSTETNEKDALVKKHIETLEALNIVLAYTNTEIEKQLTSKTKEAVNNLNAILVSLDTTQYKAKFPILVKSINNLTTNYNDHVEKINTIKVDLEEISLNHDAVITVFNKHHLENENIFGSLKNREGVLQHVQNVSNEISERLKQYDSEIKSIIEKRDQLPIYQLAETRKYQ